MDRSSKVAPTGVEKIGVEGYLHDVSDIMQAQSSSTKYFEATLQEADKTSRIVVFTPKRRNEFAIAEKDRSPVQLHDVAFRQSRYKPCEMDIIVSDRTRMSLKRKLDFAFASGQQCDTTEMTLQEITHDPRENLDVNVTVKIIELKESRTIATRNGPRKISVYAVADSTGTMDLTVWGEKEVVISEWYNCTRVFVKEFKGQYTLNCSYKTAMTITHDQGHAAEAPSDVTDITGDLIGASVNRAYYCPKRHIVDKVNDNTVCSRCTVCNMSYRNKVLTVEVSAQLSVKGVDENIYTVSVDNTLLREAVPLSGISNNILSVEAEICSHEKVHLKVRGERALAMDFAQAANLTQNPYIEDNMALPDAPVLCTRLFDAADDSSASSEKHLGKQKLTKRHSKK